MYRDKALVKNSFGVSYLMEANETYFDKLDTFGGSSLNRKKKGNKKEEILVNPIFDELKRREKLKKEQTKKRRKENVLSSRSKSKIRTKIHALAGVLPHLVFMTLTFSNKVEDRVAIKVLKRFLNNVRKRKPEFEYIWVAEKQTKNKAFKNNIHFHLITNIYWKIDRWLSYWIEVQKKFGIEVREGTKVAGSAFDVRKVKSTNSRQIGGYLAGYLNKQDETFDCPVWNCSKRVSRLYTAFYSGLGFIKQLRKLESENLLGGRLKTILTEWCAIMLIPINQKNMRFYECIHEINKAVWFGQEKEQTR